MAQSLPWAFPQSSGVSKDPAYRLPWLSAGICSPSAGSWATPIPPAHKVLGERCFSSLPFTLGLKCHLSELHFNLSVFNLAKALIGRQAHPLKGMHNSSARRPEDLSSRAREGGGREGQGEKERGGGRIGKEGWAGGFQGEVREETWNNLPSL